MKIGFHNIERGTKKNRVNQIVLTIVLLIAAFCSASLHAIEALGERLESCFENPPTTACPQTWWHWITGNVSKEGITADLESMRRVGLSEACIFTIGGGAPQGPMKTMDPQFFEMVEYAAKECQRLGLSLSLHNCPGWSASGGPWVKPADAMQFVTTSEFTVEGPRKFKGKLPLPPMKHNYYRDIEVFAFPIPADEDELVTPDNPLTITTNAQGLDTNPKLNISSESFVTFPAPEKNKPYYIQVELKKPVTVVALMFRVKFPIGFGGELMISDDGVSFKKKCRFDLKSVDQNGYAHIPVGPEPVTARVFRFVCISSFNDTAPKISEIRLSARHFTPNFLIKAGYKTNHTIDKAQDMNRDAMRPFADDSAVRLSKMVKLSSQMTEDGELTWDVPHGKWTLLRLGYTPTGRYNGGPWQGLECDKMTPSGVEASWNGMMQPIVNRLGSLSGTTLVHSLIDSFEAGGQNWTPKMVKEFTKRRGYDPVRYLPTLTGRVVENPAITERFLWDLRRTCADLIAENYYKAFTDLCRRNGLGSMSEPYHGPLESMLAGAQVDIPMAEFWQDADFETVKTVSSIGHGYGKQIVAAESFTGQPEKHGCFKDDPYSMKAFGDKMYCWGINRFVFHSFVHQPWSNRVPGMKLGPYGINLNRHNTWFEMAGPWMKYLSRCQYMLQQGRTHADVAYYCGQNAPVVGRGNKPTLPKGYYYDDINTDLLMNHARVVDGRIVLKSGASYAVLVLPSTDPQMTPEMLKNIRDLVRDGATVMGMRPTYSPSLQGYPACDTQVGALAKELWGDIDGKTITEHKFGKGRVVFGKDLQTVLTELQITSDCMAPDSVDFIHRSMGEVDLYFVAHTGEKAIREACSFRISGKIPELWHPDTGKIEEAPEYRLEGERVIVPMEFDPNGSVFVVFRNKAVPGMNQKKREHVLALETTVDVAGSWRIDFPPNWGAPVTVNLDRLISWTDHTDPGIRYFSGTATYRKQFEMSPEWSNNDHSVWLNLGTVKNLARVKINGQDLGILWKPPFRVDVGSVIKPGENALEIQVVNLWPNRLIGDEQLPLDADLPWRQEKTGMYLDKTNWPEWFIHGKPSPTGRLTFASYRHFTKDSPLLPSGLLGPVRLEIYK